MLFFSTLVSLPILAIAAAVSQPDATGSFTWYNVGLGACGNTNTDAELVAAVSATVFKNKAACGQKIRVSYQGRSADVTIVDLCTGCAVNDIDLSPTAFQQTVGDLGTGRATGDWTYI